jgi:hypothetical protein
MKHLPALHSCRSIAVTLVLLLAAVFFLPYLFPVAPAVSLSYFFGFNNRAAFLLFSLGSVIFAVLCRKGFSASISADQTLGLPSLFGALLLTFALCAYRLFPFGRHQIGGEALYALNRVQMLVQGLRPYSDFEFAYGPAHLYIPVLLKRLPHSSVMDGYYAWWTVQWLVGVAILWSAIRLFRLPMPHRSMVFWIVLAILLPAMMNEGTAYTPTRSIGPVFFVVLISWIIDRGKQPFLVAATALLCIAAALSISPEEGLAVFAGLLIWFSLLAVTGRVMLRARDFILFLTGTAIVLICCWRMGEFSTLFTFSHGAYAFPLLPSPTNIVILITYVAAACAGIDALLHRRYDSVAIPMFLTGFALLPAAMGRCDYGHLLMASPILILGVGALCSRIDRNSRRSCAFLSAVSRAAKPTGSFRDAHDCFRRRSRCVCASSMPVPLPHCQYRPDSL